MLVFRCEDGAAEQDWARTGAPKPNNSTEISPSLSALPKISSSFVSQIPRFRTQILRLASFVTRPVWFQSETKMFAAESMKQPCAALNAPDLMSRGSIS